jgi:glycosyltransferase involved in cell wall biosynthesis
MRILIIIDGLPGGGAEKVVLTLCQGMQKSGVDVTLISLRDVCHYPIPEKLNYKVVVDHSRTPWRKLTELSRRGKQLDKAVLEIENERGRFDMILSNLHKTDRIVMKSSLYSSDRLWFCIHGILSTTYLGHRKGLNRWNKRRKMASVYEKKNVVAVSEAVGVDLQENILANPRNVQVINNPFNIAEIKAMAEQPCDMAGQEYLLHVGRFHVQKRHDRLLEAYAKTKLQVPLVLIGTGSDIYVNKIKNLAEKLNIADRVIFAGFKENPFPYIKHARQLILSSDSEGFGNVLVEALICGTPVVSTACPGGPVEILKNTGMHRGLADVDTQSLGQKIVEIYNNPPDIDQSLLEIYGIDYICNRYKDLAKK